MSQGITLKSSLAEDSVSRRGLYFDQLRGECSSLKLAITNRTILTGNSGEIINILDRDVYVQDTIRKLERELAVYKRAYAGLEAEKSRLEVLKEDVEKQRDDLDIQLKVSSGRCSYQCSSS